MSFGELSDLSALLSLPLFPIYGVSAVAVAGGWDGVRRRGAEAVFLGAPAGVGKLLTSVYVIPELAGALGGLAAAAAFLSWGWRRPPRRGGPDRKGTPPNSRP